jgi:pyruvate dehydrogenase E2 component (dihydrolipoamide acetyltransferase)
MHPSFEHLLTGAALPDVTMPRLSDSMGEGVILAWLCAEGSRIERGMELVEIETDKATVIYEAPESGVLHDLAAAGQPIQVGDRIAHITEPASTNETMAAHPPRSAAESPAVTAGSSVLAAVPNASPTARRLAKELGIDLATVAGTGSQGRILREDVVAAERTEPFSKHRREPPEVPAERARPAVGSQPEIIAPSRSQRLIAERMTRARQSIPEFTVVREVDMSAVVLIRQQFSAAGTTRRPTINDMVVRAVALALRENPGINAAYRGEHFERYSNINIGIAVAAGDSLIVPVIRDADTKSLAQIAQSAHDLIGRARARRLHPEEVDGGTFTISNLGMFEISAFTAIIHQGQGAILAVGAVRAEPVAKDGEVTVGHRMTLTMACDHRLIYGAQAAAFLDRVAQLLRDPLAL